MLEKLFARLRWRRQSDLAAPQAGHVLPLPASPLVGTGLRALDDSPTPPPLPADAWAESESGIVITDSGIIILGPTSEPLKPPASELPAAPPSEPTRRALTPGEMDWDDVLARARARAQEASGAGGPPPTKAARARRGKNSKTSK